MTAVVVVDGLFGYTEPDGTQVGRTPELIRHVTRATTSTRSGSKADSRATPRSTRSSWRFSDRLNLGRPDQGFGELQEVLTGNSPRTHVVHFRDLEQLGLVDPTTGDALLRVGDRIVALRDYRTGELVQAVRTPPGLYLTEAQPQFGLGLRRNLLLATFTERAQARAFLHAAFRRRLTTSPHRVSRRPRADQQPAQLAMTV